MKNTQQPSDEFNPNFIFALTHTELLVKIAKGELDLKELVILQLKSRGYDAEGIRIKNW